MADLTIDQLIYLLYAKAHTKTIEAETVTKGTVKSCLPIDWKEKAEEAYDFLKKNHLITSTTKEGKDTKREGRFLVTKQGEKALVTNLATANYDFTALKSYKVLNTLLACLLTYIKETTETHSQGRSSKEMTFDEFQEKFKSLYLKERKHQELSGVVAIHKSDLLIKFQDANSVALSPETLEKYFGKLKSGGTVFISKGEKDELIHWVE